MMINTEGLLFTTKVTALRMRATLERIQKIDVSIIKISLSFVKYSESDCIIRNDHQHAFCERESSY